VASHTSSSSSVIGSAGSQSKRRSVVLLPNCRFRSSCHSSTISRKLLSGVTTVALIFLPGSRCHTDLRGSMTSAPMAPLLACSMGSEDIRFVAPNSMGVARKKLPAMGRTSPAYHTKSRQSPGSTVVLVLIPASEPSARCTS
jgi:hypothetical protein